MVKALVTYEGVGYMLDPEFNVARVSQRHVGRIIRQHFNPIRLLRETLRGAPELVELVVKLPLLVSEGLDLVERQSRRQPDNPFTGLRGTVFGGACLIAGAVLAGLGGPWLVWGPLLLLGLLVSLRRGA
jgi:ubiquinone biosynthesis protein